MRSPTRHVTVLAVALAVPLLAGCVGDDQASKAGGSDGPVTLRIGTDDPEDRPSAAQIEEFARRVDKLSGGDLRIEPVWRAAGVGVSDWDQRVARMVKSGELDMGLIPSRAWDTEGVTSLRALNTPFLITSDELVAEVVAGGLAAEMLAGLEEAGVVGLALFPEGLRHPFGYKAALRGPEDYRGKAIRSPTSKTVSALLEALGAEPTDEEVSVDTQGGMESSYSLEPPGTAAGNVTFFPKTNALVIGDEVFEGLDERQRDVLRKAAAGTRGWAIETTPSDAEAARAHCERGNAVVLVGDEDIAALEKAAAPVIAGLERDDQTRRLIDRIRDLRRQTTVSATAPVRCGNPGGPAAGGGDRSAPAGADHPSTLAGVYRFEVTEEDLRAEGVTDPGLIAENVGIQTWTIADGGWCWEQKAPNPVNNPDDCGAYEVSGDRFTIYFPDGASETHRWQLTPEGDLRFDATGVEDPVGRAIAARPWKRIADADEKPTLD
jgi:TRAP-type C4-dicarboxylate transport system substrate-binding protein